MLSKPCLLLTTRHCQRITDPRYFRRMATISTASSNNKTTHIERTASQPRDPVPTPFHSYPGSLLTATVSTSCHLKQGRTNQPLYSSSRVNPNIIGERGKWEDKTLARSMARRAYPLPRQTWRLHYHESAFYPPYFRAIFGTGGAENR